MGRKEDIAQTIVSIQGGRQGTKCNAHEPRWRRLCCFFPPSGEILEVIGDRRGFVPQLPFGFHDGNHTLGCDRLTTGLGVRRLLSMSLISYFPSLHQGFPIHEIKGWVAFFHGGIGGPPGSGCLYLARATKLRWLPRRKQGPGDKHHLSAS